jgi:hypothetical protein
MLYIDDWKRKKYSYQTAFEGEEYHLVKKANEPGYEI